MRIPTSSAAYISSCLSARLLPRPVLRTAVSASSATQQRCLATSTTISTTSGSTSSVPTNKHKNALPAVARPATRPLQYSFQPNFSLFAKRPPRPFPPPFHSPPLSSFSDPLGTHNLSRVPRSEGAHFLRGITNGDDAIVYAPSYLGVADGVGAWNTKSAGHAALWSRLMLHFFSLEVESSPSTVDPVHCLTKAYHSTLHATTESTATVWQGTTTACVTTLHGNTLTVANVGDSRCWVFRPSKRDFILKTTEQWHWFDCPKQLGTNSPDTPAVDADVHTVNLEDGDIIILATDGLPDNMWDHEILSLCKERVGHTGPELAERLVRAAKKVAIDPFGESPYMERAIDEGLSIEGGKWDDISVVTAVFRARR